MISDVYGICMRDVHNTITAYLRIWIYFICFSTKYNLKVDKNVYQNAQKNSFQTNHLGGNLFQLFNCLWTRNSQLSLTCFFIYWRVYLRFFPILHKIQKRPEIWFQQRLVYWFNIEFKYKRFKPCIFLINKFIFVFSILHTGDELECPFEWIRRIDFGACYFFSNETMSWDDSQVIMDNLMFSIFIMCN